MSAYRRVNTRSSLDIFTTHIIGSPAGTLKAQQGNNSKGAFMIEREHWWITQLKEKEAEEALKWFEEQKRLAEYAEKERIIIQAFQKEISKKRDEIEKLHIEIKNLEKKCNQCLVKISVGDTGVQDLLVEENTKK